MSLKVSILQTLNMKSKALVTPEVLLLNQIRAVADPVPTVSEFKQAVRELEEAGYVTAVRDAIDAEVLKFRITDAGRAEVASR
jgi:hypothetical protein